jgi:hypothetical protein
LASKPKKTPQPSEDEQEDADDEDVGPPPPPRAEKKQRRLRPVARTSSDDARKRTTTANPATPDAKKQKTEAETETVQASADDAPPSASKKQKLESLGAGRPMPASRRAALEQRMTVQVCALNIFFVVRTTFLLINTTHNIFKYWMLIVLILTCCR